MKTPAAVLAAALVLAPIATFAQAISGGHDNEAVPAHVIPKERAAGVAPTPAQQHATDHKLQQLDKDLLKNEGKSTANVPAIAEHTNP